LADTYNQLIRAGGTLPAIITQPLAQVITVGGPVTFSVTASGTGPFTYQWLKNNVAISGATGATYSIASVAAGDAGNYAVMVTNPLGNTTDLFLSWRFTVYHTGRALRRVAAQMSNAAIMMSPHGGMVGLSEERKVR
jgi:hypothetical protein